MKNIIVSSEFDNNVSKEHFVDSSDLPAVLVVTPYSNEESDIALYSRNLIKIINEKFINLISVQVCALEIGNKKHLYSNEVKYIINTSLVEEYVKLAININNEEHLKIILLQYELVLFIAQEKAFIQFLYEVSKPVIIFFHTVLPNPDEELKSKIKNIVDVCESIIVFNNISFEILLNQYDVPGIKIYLYQINNSCTYCFNIENANMHLNQEAGSAISYLMKRLAF
ncbi:MAG: hypothetical protein HY951_05365 [Bacteroidia bacterium]|nr:hypothetical protein [Bacteroidia bacterium]